MWELNSYRDLLSENSGRHHVIGSGLLVATAVALMFVLLA